MHANRAMLVEVVDVVYVATAVVMAGVEVDTCFDFSNFLPFLPFLSFLESSLSAILRIILKKSNCQYENK